MDYNDMAQSHGPEAVRESVANAQPVTEDAMARLAALSPLEYDKIREAEAQRLEIRVSTLDKALSDFKKSQKQNQSSASSGEAVSFPDPEPWFEPVNGAELLDEIMMNLKRFVICQRETEILATLWIAHTWFVDFFNYSPRALITAPDAGCGKSILAGFLAALSRRSLKTEGITAPSLFRVIAGHRPTVVLEESDTFLKESEDIRALINAGHRRGGKVIRLEKVNDSYEPRQFDVFGSMVVCGINALDLHKSIVTRSLVFEMRRNLPTETVESLSDAENSGAFDDLVRKLARFAMDCGEAIGAMHTDFPDTIHGRARDNYRPILAIADYAGGNWPALARWAAQKSESNAKAEKNASTDEQLLSDIQGIFEKRGVDSISCQDLLAALISDDESSWPTYNRGKAISQQQIGKRLGRFGIYSRSVRFGCEVKKAYKKASFLETWERFLHREVPSVSPEPPDFSGYRLQPAPAPENTVTGPVSEKGCGYVKSPVNTGFVTGNRTKGGMPEKEGDAVTGINPEDHVEVTL